MDNDLSRVVSCLEKAHAVRNDEDIRFLHSYLSHQLWFRDLRSDEVEDLCLTGRYEKYNVGNVVYRKGDTVRSWYVLLSGNVIIGTLLFAPPVCFGRKANMSSRTDDCLVLDPSQIITVDYCPSASVDRCISQVRLISKSHSFSGHDCPTHQLKDFDCSSERGANHGSALEKSLLQNEDFSKESDSSSLFSVPGSDIMTSSAGNHGFDLTGLLESTVDSEDDGSNDDDDDDGDVSYSDNVKGSIVPDAVVEALEKDDKSEKDIKLILDLVQHLPAFNNMTSNVRKSLCSVMRYTHIEGSNTFLVPGGVHLNAWVVILNGLIEVDDGCEINILQTGDCFEIIPSKEKQIKEKVIRTKSEGCQFLLVPQEDYCRILNEGEENISKVYENGEVVLVLENRKVPGRDEKVKMIIRGQPNRLLKELFHQEDGNDPTFVQDFFLTYRTFFKFPAQVAYKIMEYLEMSTYRDKVVSIFLDWMNWHYRDFEDNPEMRTFFEHLEKRLEDLGMPNQLDLLTVTCARLSKTRVVVLNRKSRDEHLQFEIMAGMNQPSLVFINHVEEGSKAQEAGLGRGDQILDVNAKSFKHITHKEALVFLQSATHLSIIVKYNMSEYKLQQNKPSGKISGSSHVQSSHADNNQKGPKNKEIKSRTVLPRNLEDPGKPPVLGKIKNKLLRVLPRNALGSIISTSDLIEGGREKNQTLRGTKGRFGSSHPDLSSLHLSQNNSTSDFVTMNDLNVLKIYREDQSYKFVFVDKEITAQQVVMLTMKEFGLNQISRDFALYEVTLHSDNCVKQKRLPNNLQTLAERSSFKSRYYIKHLDGDTNLLPDECLEEFRKECQLNFLSLNCAEVAAQLTYKDFELFSKISESEYIEELFPIKNASKSKQNDQKTQSQSSSNLEQFARLANTEMFWVVTHICNEQNLSHRVKAIKHFVQIAKHCVECKNFNSAFAIISGLGHQSVLRLKQTWDKLPSKSQNLFEKLQVLMDPSRNMCKYRSSLNAEKPPLIPFYPLIMKDLTFINLGNDSIIDGLINFEKLRMIAKEIHQVSNMAPSHNSINYSSLNSSAMAMMRKKTDNLTVLSKKKMFEEAQMVRKVRTYLSSYKLVEDENQLAEMSNCCEPTGGTTKRFDNSINLTRVTMLSSSGPKFGTNSPENIRKLVSLSAGSKPFEGLTRSAEDIKLSKFECANDTPKSSESAIFDIEDKLYKKQNLSTHHSNSQFYVPFKSPNQLKNTNFHSENVGHGSSKHKSSRQETDSGRFSYSGDDSSIGSGNSTHNSPLISGNLGNFKHHIKNCGFPIKHKTYEVFIPATNNFHSDQSQASNIGPTIPYHLAANRKKKAFNKRSILAQENESESSYFLLPPGKFKEKSETERQQN